MTPGPTSEADALSAPPFKIIYDKSRFPILQRRVDGTLGCRGCGGAIPKGRSAWCSRECCKKYNPQFVLAAVRARDHDICSECGRDCDKEYNQWMAEKFGGKNFNWNEWRNRKPPGAEYDHIVPFSEGGLTVLENMRTLCSPCHKKRTADWHWQRTNKRRNQEVLL